MIEDAVTLGLGFLVYKRLMSEVSDTPINQGVAVKAGDMFGFGDLTAAEIRQAYIPQGEGTFSDIWKGSGPYGKGLTAAEMRPLGVDAPPLPKGGKWAWEFINGTATQTAMPQEGWKLRLPFLPSELGTTKEIGRVGLRPKGL